MAYRKTDKVLAHMEERKTAMISAALDIIARHGLGTLTTTDIAAGAGVASGLFYKYFPDKDQLLAELASRALARDLEALRAAALGEHRPVNALAKALAALYSRFRKPRLVKALLDMPGYRGGIRNELARLAREAYEINPAEARVTASAMLGALYAVYREGGSAEFAVSFALGGLGVPSRGAAMIAGMVTMSPARL